MLTYIIIGVLYSLFLTIMMDWQIKKGIEKRNFNFLESIIIILLWPIYVFTFIRSFVNNYTKNEDD